MIAIIATKIDPHADAVVQLLSATKTPVIRIDLESAHYDYDIKVSGSDKAAHWSLISRHCSRALHSKDVKTVWWRRGTIYPNGRPALNRNTIDAEETRQVVKWLFEALPEHFYPFGHPWRIRESENKIKQLDVALSCGLQVPAFCYGNTAKSFRDLPNGECVIKSLSLATFADNGKEYSFRAVRVPEDQIKRLQEDGEGLINGFLQRMVHRSYDIRAFITLDWYHACRIDVANLPDGNIDWRPHVSKCEHRACDLDSLLLGKCRAFLRAMNMPCGHFDFAVDGFGETCFLECNPNGQWYWLELQGGCRIASDVADTLLSHAHR